MSRLPHTQELQVEGAAARHDLDDDLDLDPER
jgi:hypothetical protein